MTNDVKPDIKELFSYSNSLAEYVRTNPEGYRMFLQTAAKCEHFTPSNQLLLYGFCQGKTPDYLDDYSNWIGKGFTVNEDASLLYVMEKDNTKETGYKERVLIDVKDTNALYNPFTYDKGLVLEALMTSSPCRIEFNPDITSKAIYIPNRQVIEVSRGYKNIEQIFENLSREMVHAKIHLDMLEKDKDAQNNIKMQYPRSKYTFMAYSVSYMLASKYDMLPEQIEIKALPSEWRDMSYIGEVKEYSKADTIARTFKNEVLKPLNYVFKSLYGVLSEKINYMYNQTGSEM